MVKITFKGASQEVGRSAFLLDDGDKILLDYGVKLTPNGIEYPLPIKTNLNAAIISHAHLDHSGNLPHLFEETNCLSYMTPPTLDIAKILWFDTLKIAGLEGMDAKFSKESIAKAEKFTFPIGYDKHMDITESSSVVFRNAGHIVGSAITELHMPNSSIVYTGDFRYTETRLHGPAQLEKIRDCDVLITECTYGDRDHPDRKETEKRFVESVQETIDRGGKVLLPAFAVGRSQEILDVLNEYKVNAPVFFDGMGQKVAEIYLKNPSYLKNPKMLAKALQRVNWVRNAKLRKQAQKEPCIIVCTSGMMQGGSVYAYLPQIYNDKSSKIILSGFQVDETPGKILMETGKLDIDGVNVTVKAGIERYDFSAHAGREELLRAINKLSPQKVVCVHGDAEVTKKFAKAVKDEGYIAIIPELGKEMEL
ncbi:MAG TPA: MBL fold metallo-hydrolase [Candidatus Diapherotrites archaeon]|uniref:MBL fold metallo-hydrolase n=1 Tax=Candidatus Iainarchaeum sp. TaxID=3101447 RepID=A0A7J4IVR1_9ARCH|nr:MBL fold metallo-hydrolase [Candidatus Diapherotrites archaeon]